MVLIPKSLALPNQLHFLPSLSYSNYYSFIQLPKSEILLSSWSPPSPSPCTSLSYQVLEIQTPTNVALSLHPTALHISPLDNFYSPTIVSLLPVSPLSHLFSYPKSQECSFFEMNPSVSQSLSLKSFHVCL